MTENAGKQLGTHALFQKQQHSQTKQARTAPVIIADGLHTPENIGSLIRLADAMGSKRVLLVDEEIGLSTKKIGRIARGTDKHIEIVQVTKQQFLNMSAGLQPMVAIELTTRAENLLETALPAQCSLVVGSERHGISEDVLGCCQRSVYIPMFGINGSMNVTHALAMVLYEWRRQHRD